MLDIHGVFLYTNLMNKNKNLNLKNYFICNNEDLSVAYIKRCEKFLRQLNYKLKQNDKKRLHSDRYNTKQI